MQRQIVRFNLKLTCTVALGSQAIAIKSFSLNTKRFPNTAKNVTKIRKSNPQHSTPMPLPVTKLKTVYKYTTNCCQLTPQKQQCYRITNMTELSLINICHNEE